VVDAKRGLILTNRHVVTPGPVVAEAVFLNNEEVDLEVVYRDPVHDFGLFRFDPAAVKFMKVPELALAPERARVGTEIRVIGNDAGEKLSILAGTLARLDRDAPPYGRDTYNDFNTFYLQAASGTSGGSSGSPVIDIEGRVLALNAGANRMAATSFFLPLDRVAHAVERLREGMPVPRGTLQAVLLYRPYDEVRRLGLRESTEREMRARFPQGTGLLVVSEIVPGGPADGALEPGDVVLRVNGKLLNAFVPLAEALDDSVGTTVRIDVERGGEPRTFEVAVSDLHAITPSAYVEAGGGVFNTLSFQMARNFSLPVRGVYVADPGYALRRAGVGGSSVVTSLAETPTPDLASFASTWASLADGARVPLRFFSLTNPRVESVAVVEIDRRWFPLRTCSEGPSGAGWSCVDAGAAPAAEPLRARSTRLAPANDRAARALAASLVSVDFQIPFPIDGVPGTTFRGAGLVVDHERGLVVVDRETVPIALGDISLSFSASIRVPGELVYLHPEHNLAVLRYDPALLGETPIRSAELRPGHLAVGDDVWLVGLSAEESLVSRKSSVSRLEPVQLPLPRVPRFRETNLEVATLADTVPSVGGVVADDRGRVLALWASFSSGSGDDLRSSMRAIPIERVMEIVEPLRAGRPVAWRSLGVEWQALTLAEARERGIPDEIAARLEAGRGSTLPRVLSVLRRVAGSPSQDQLRQGDLLVAIDGSAAPTFSDVERASQRGVVDLTVVRAGQTLELRVPTIELDGNGTDRALVWGGAVLQSQPRAVAAQRGIAPLGVYVSFYFYGSPANRYGLRPTSRITAVDGKETPDLESFLLAIQDKPDHGTVRLRTVDLESKERAMTLELDLKYWPTYELRREASGWKRSERSLRIDADARPRPPAVQ
jgi:pro-apoptotic serine protease NMA111